jgi:hypothetical protein
MGFEVGSPPPRPAVSPRGPHDLHAGSRRRSRPLHAFGAPGLGVAGDAPGPPDGRAPSRGEGIACPGPGGSRLWRARPGVLSCVTFGPATTCRRERAHPAMPWPAPRPEASLLTPGGRTLPAGWQPLRPGLGPAIAARRPRLRVQGPRALADGRCRSEGAPPWGDGKAAPSLREPPAGGPWRGRRAGGCPLTRTSRCPGSGP